MLLLWTVCLTIHINVWIRCSWNLLSCVMLVLHVALSLVSPIALLVQDWCFKMPCYGFISKQQQYPRQWEECQRKVAKQMIDAGWNKHARKFDEVLKRKANKLFVTS